jgi:hypothetical protein
MTLAQLYAGIYDLIGTNIREVPPGDLDGFILSSLSWLASELKFDIRTEENIGIEADQRELILPSDFGWLLWLEWNGTRLDPVSLSAGNRDGDNWHTLDSGTLREYAIQGRRLVLLPPADSDSIDTSATLSWRYIAIPTSLSPSGIPGLSEADQQLVRFDSAIQWLGAHPSEVSAAKIQAYTAEINRRLPAAKRRAEAPIESYAASFVPFHGRQGGAR